MTVIDVPASHAEQELGPLRALLASDDVNEVVINPDGRVWVERADALHMAQWNGDMPAARLRMLGSHLAGETGNQLGPRHPIVSGRVRVFGHSVRVQAIVPRRSRRASRSRSERMAMMVLRAGLNQTRRDVLDNARATIDLIVQVGRRDSRRGVLEVYLPALAA